MALTCDVIACRHAKWYCEVLVDQQDIPLIALAKESRLPNSGLGNASQRPNKVGDRVEGGNCLHELNVRVNWRNRRVASIHGRRR